eukprot:TRINITY_DN68143_c6_g12_i1.p1 TRINITY_DN68143_c6_g12~~TRINITY_DN68143_c6_g12_i1.p1  ORF type:complete len:263 (-),score=23.70 TRINITY_DN68143_c6_g12_i1:280-1044(-)
MAELEVAQNTTAHYPTEAHLRNEKRYVRIQDRKEEDAFDVRLWKNFFDAQYKNEWHGANVLKTTFELTLYPELIKREKIGTVIEFGSYQGGALCQLAETLNGLGHKDIKFVGVDIDLSNLHPDAANHHLVKFVQGSTTEGAALFTPEFIAAHPKPWFIIEDAHYGCKELLDFLHPILSSGDYVVVEDTNLNMEKACEELYPDLDREEIRVCIENLTVVKNFLTAHGEEYLIDTFYQDWFGYNCLKHWNSLFRKM